jgi:tRNA modification GTPase
LNNSTIVALATPPGAGAISVIRMSGSDALAICDRVFRGSHLPSRAPERSAILGEIVAEDGSPVDQVLVLVMREPRSYTGEDVVEISCHGGNVAPRLVLRRLIEAGAEPAEAGEFTKRAFLNGKMDLTQAEAVADIVRAGSEKALKAALRQLKGELSKQVSGLEGDLFETLVRIDAAVDFPEEEDIEGLLEPSLSERLGATVSKMEDLLAAHESGRHLKQGLDVVIVGKPNVGKSSLFNCLVGEDRVITSDLPGTTRDVVDSLISLDGLMLRLHDTAGVRVAAGGIEAEAVARTHRVTADADVALLVIDASSHLTDEDQEALGSVASKPHIVVANKCDLPEDADIGTLANAIRISALKGWGIPALAEALKELAYDGLRDLDCEVVTSERHAACIRAALENTIRAAGAARDGLAPEFVAADVRLALDSLGEITGRKFSDSVLDEIFSRFCIGK